MEEYTNFEGLEVLEDCGEIFDTCEEIWIAEVRERPCLWDQRIDVRLRGLDITKQAWKEISEILDMDPKVVQKKWKNLRDTFRRKHQEQNIYVPSGSEAGKQRVQWKFYHHLEFLLPTIQFRKTISNLSGFSKDNSHAGKETVRPPLLTVSPPPLSQSSETAGTLIQSDLLTASKSSFSQPSGRTVLPRSLLRKKSPSPICTPEIMSPFSVPNRPSPSISPALSPSWDIPKKRRRSSSGESNDSQMKRIREEKQFENIMSQLSEKPSEEQAFCNYLQCRLEKLQRKYFMKITNSILLELMKVEAEQMEENG